MGTKKLTVIATSSASLESIENSVISVVNQRRAKDQANNYIGDVFAVQHKAQFYVVDDDFISTVKSDGNVLKTDYVTSTKLGEELAKIPSSGMITLDENKVNELIDNKITTLDLDNKFSSKASISDVYTKSEIDGKLATVSAGGNVNLDGYATKEELNNKVTQSIIVDKGEARIENEVTGGGAKFLGETYNSFAGVNDGGDDVYALMYARDKAKLGTRVWLNPNGAYYSKNSSTYESIEDNEIVTKKDIANLKANADLSGYTTTDQLNLALSGKADKTMVEGLVTKIEVNEEIAKLATKDEITPISEKIIVIEESIEGLASKDEIVVLATKEEVTNSLATKADSSVIPTLATKDELSNKVDRSELDTKANSSDILNLATKAELGKYALKSDIPTGVTVDDEQVARAVNENSKIQELSSAVANMASNLQGATYPQVVATMKYLGYELPTTLAAYENFNAFGDDRLSGDTTITLTPITYDGSYGQAWERVAIYNEASEMLVAKYATISSDGLSIDVIYAEDGHTSNDGVADIPENYELLDGEVKGKVVLGAIDYHGDAKTILNHFAASGEYTEIFLGIEHNTKPWSFTFYDYKPSKFSVRNGTEVYGGYGRMTKYNLKLEIGDWSKEFVYENSKAVNDIVVDFKNLSLGSDEKLIELAKAWNVPLTAYNFYDDILTAKGVLLSPELGGQNENFRPNQSAITLNTTKESIEVSADINVLLEYPSSNEAQGTGKWIGIGIDTGKPSILGVSVDNYELQQSDIDEAKAVGLNDGSFVFWFKAEQDYTRTLILRSGELERSVNVVFKQVDTPVNTQGSSTVSPTSPLPDGESTNNQNFSDIIVME